MPRVLYDGRVVPQRTWTTDSPWLVKRAVVFPCSQSIQTKYDAFVTSAYWREWHIYKEIRMMDIGEMN